MRNERSAVEFHGDRVVTVEKIISDADTQQLLARTAFYDSLREEQDQSKEEGEE